MTYLSRLAALGLAKESTQGTYVAPTDSIPFDKASYEDVIEPLRDETIRTNDAVLQGLYQGVWTTTWDIDTKAYPDITGHWLRGMIGPDVVTAGVSTTLSSTTDSTHIATVASIAANSIFQIDTGTNIEYAKVASVSGSGPYNLVLAAPGLALTHTNGVAVVSQTTHTFTQNRTNATVWPSYSLTVWDGADNTRGFPGQVMSELQIKIDPKGIVTFSPKFMGWPSATQAAFVPAYTATQPQRGWGWTMTNPGASTRGLTYDLTLKRAVEPIHSSDGTQGPREVFPGAMESEGTYKAIFENTTDYGLFYNYSQGVTTATLTEPVGGQMNAGTSIALTMSKSGYHKFVPDLGQTYIQASYDLSGINNATDSGIATVVLKNFRTTSY